MVYLQRLNLNVHLASSPSQVTLISSGIDMVTAPSISSLRSCFCCTNLGCLPRLFSVASHPDSQLLRYAHSIPDSRLGMVFSKQTILFVCLASSRIADHSNSYRHFYAHTIPNRRLGMVFS
jgi:hypothetical protein